MKDLERTAKEDLVKFICKDKEEQDKLLEAMDKLFTIKYGEEGLNHELCHAADSAPVLRIVEDDETKNEKEIISLKTKVTGVEIIYPELSEEAYITGYIHHYNVDMRHELFHSLCDILNDSKVRVDIKNAIFTLNLGGKICNNTFTNARDCRNTEYITQLFAEIITDLSAYCSYYEKYGISTNEIIYGEGLETIDSIYKHGNGYWELLPLGLCLINAFSNKKFDFETSDKLDLFKGKIPNNNGETIYYNDLFHGVLYNPMRLKDEFIKYSSEENWQELERIAKIIINDFERENRKVDPNNINAILNIITKYLNNKISMTSDETLKKNLLEVKESFDESYKKALVYYGLSGYNRNPR